jgi:hypothetical protein
MTHIAGESRAPGQQWKREAEKQNSECLLRNMVQHGAIG